MNLIQVILIGGFLIASILCHVALKNRLIARLFFLGQFGLGVILTFCPELSQWAADFLGVGRGTDLILYLLVLYVYVGSILILGKFRQLERSLTDLTRQIALAKPESPGASTASNHPSE